MSYVINGTYSKHSHKEYLRKCRLAKEQKGSKEVYDYLKEQIIICEDLARPLSDEKIIELAKLPISQVKPKIRQIKFS